MKKLSLILGLSSSLAFGQDLHFTQTSQTPLLVNPGAAGVMDGWERVIVNQRNQWLGGGTQFNTTNAAIDFNLFKSERYNAAHIGVGLMFFNDVGGDSRFGHQSGSATMSGILPIGDASVLSVGIQGGFGNRSGDVSRLTFYNQWDGDQFNSAYASGEQNNLSSFRYAEANAGIFYQFDGGRNTFQRNWKTKIQVGAAGYHLNAPRLRFSNGTESERLYRKYVGMLGVITDIGTSRMAIDANLVGTMQGPHKEMILGLLLRYRFEDATKITGNSHDSYIGLGAFVRTRDAIGPTVQIDWRGYHLGVSYDITISPLRYGYRGGTLEFSLAYTNFNDALFKSRSGRFRW